MSVVWCAENQIYFRRVHSQISMAKPNFLKKNQSYADDSKSEDRVMVSKGWVSLSAFSCSFFPWWAILRGTWVALEFVLRFL